MDEKNELPSDYHVLPESIPFRVPNFQKHFHSQWKTLAPGQIECENWYYQFVERVMAARGTSFLPICRISDGEYRFLLGAPPVSPRVHWKTRWAQEVKRWIADHVLRRDAFMARTSPFVSSGDYSAQEWRLKKDSFGEGLLWLANTGVLALHLSYFSRPTVEDYFKPFGAWMTKNGLRLDFNNYVPFYFVYGLLAGPDRTQLLQGMKVLVLHSAQGEKQNRIIAELGKCEPASIVWKQISRNRSLFDSIRLSDEDLGLDLCLIGGGVGKVNLFCQLKQFRGPCIDAGYLFEVWADEELKWNRAFCVPDQEMDFDRVSFALPSEVAEMRKNHCQ